MSVQTCHSQTEPGTLVTEIATVCVPRLLDMTAHLAVFISTDGETEAPRG